MHELVVILDFGSQYTQLIARRVRESHVYCEIHPYNVGLDTIKAKAPKAIILSGSPSSIYAEDAPLVEKEIFDMSIPVLGICYGMSMLAHFYNGEMDQAPKREYGKAELQVDDAGDLLEGVDANSVVWMSHGDHMHKMPDGFRVIGHTDNAEMAAIRHTEKPLYGLQFHPEVHHSVQGAAIIRNFLFKITGCSGDWTPGSFIEETLQNIRRQVGDGRVLCALSGGVDSSVVAVLLQKAIGDQLTCVFVDNGLLRADEREHVEATFRKHYQMNLIVVDASQMFYDRLKGVTDPEKKRKIIGNSFIDVFDQEADKIGKVDFLAQGTLYPDLIESVSFKGPSATIKSHHNVGGLPEHMNLELVEPLKELFKDEVRIVGAELGMPQEILGRHPFPGPGLGVRILGDITPEKVEVLQKADKIFIDEIREHGEYDNIWQALTVLLPVKSVGVMGDLRTYENAVAIRAVTSVDGMTADWYRMPPEVLAVISNRIINEVRGINRVVYDISSKPPATIEWE